LLTSVFLYAYLYFCKDSVATVSLVESYQLNLARSEDIQICSFFRLW